MLPTTPEGLDLFLIEKEGPTLECKAARTTFDSRKLRKYLCALANEGGGHFVLGVSDQPPRHVLGTTALPNVYADLNQIQQDLRPPPALNAREVDHPDGRVLVFEVAARPRGQAIRYDNIPWARRGESLVPMDDAVLRAVLLEDADASAEICLGATLDDLDGDALAAFRTGIVDKALGEQQKARYTAMNVPALLQATGLIHRDGALTRAALLLLGTDTALREWANNAEVIFEYRRVPTSTRYDQRVPLRRAILLAVDELWGAIQHYAFDDPIEVTERTRVVQVPRYPERSIREALLNAIVHRDYHDPESVIVRMSPDTFVVDSPGPFPANITPENVADEQYRRNRVLAEALDKCGQIERSGQGVDLMIEAAVRMAQPLPSFEEPDGRRVRVTLHGAADPTVLPILQRVPTETWAAMSTSELVALDAVRRGTSRREIDPAVALRLIERGLIEPGGRGDAPYVYGARLRATTAGLLIAPVLNALIAHPDGITLSNLAGSIGTADVDSLKRTLQWMRRADVAFTTGRTRGARWHIRPEAVRELLERSDARTA